ncbi:MAG: Endonuclease YhcR precursor [candidate division BRC1 bacterium ADurb.BinA364]|nr:MAG: Endonuclease YhcR precursor [candidate division BRC1 bacterium ADurb.BinA364]
MRHRKACYWSFLAMLCAGAAFAAPANPNKLPAVPTDPIDVTTEQLIPKEELAKHETDTMLLLHTNDIHDIIKPPAKIETLGGMAYLSGYVRKMREERPDVLMLDAGDLLEKGDTMSILSKGEVMYKALAASGCDATVPGNHDFVYGMDQLRRNIAASGLNVICAGFNYQDTGEPVFQETMIKEVDGLKIGLIGGTVAGRPVRDGDRTAVGVDMPTLGLRVNELARELEPQVDLTIMILHNGSYAGNVVANAAPLVDIVICGHTNELTEVPVKTDSGALLITVGRAAQWVGNLDMVVSKTEKKIAGYTYQLVKMDRTQIEPNEELARQIEAWDKEFALKEGEELPRRRFPRPPSPGEEMEEAPVGAGDAAE